MKFLLACASFIWMCSSVFAQQFPNVLIHEWDGNGYQPCEPSIAIRPDNPSIIVAGSILDNVYFSSDSGKTWTLQQLKSPLGVFGDPCIIATKSRFFYFHLSDPSGKGWSDNGLLDRIVVQSSKNGRKWSKGGGIWLNHPADQDKEWAASSADGKSIYCTWTQFDEYGSKDPKDSTLILFSKANHKGCNWSDPVRINQKAGNCLDDDRTVEGAVPAAGPNDEVYVAWAFDDKIWFDRSMDGGKTWLDQDIIAVEGTSGWDQQVPGVGRVNGMPVTSTDLSGGPNHGRIYINYTDQIDVNGSTKTLAYIVFSDDKGASWSEPVRIDEDNSVEHQFFTWMAVDQITGRVHVVFYQRKESAGWLTDVVWASSSDGVTFDAKVISESAFSPNSEVFFGDYNNISAHKGVIRPIWTRNDKGRLSIWTALINE
ncbi:MAG: hypothetical protein RL226_1383 [Bacteroidota bacterium]|jgi:hypothetical protein